jgi:hypothetical protein
MRCVTAVSKFLCRLLEAAGSDLPPLLLLLLSLGSGSLLSLLPLLLSPVAFACKFLGRCRWGRLLEAAGSGLPPPPLLLLLLLLLLLGSGSLLSVLPLLLGSGVFACTLLLLLLFLAAPLPLCLFSLALL